MVYGYGKSSDGCTWITEVCTTVLSYEYVFYVYVSHMHVICVIWNRYNMKSKYIYFLYTPCMLKLWKLWGKYQSLDFFFSFLATAKIFMMQWIEKSTGELGYKLTHHTPTSENGLLWPFAHGCFEHHLLSKLELRPVLLTPVLEWFKLCYVRSNWKNHMW